MTNNLYYKLDQTQDWVLEMTLKHIAFMTGACLIAFAILSTSLFVFVNFPTWIRGNTDNLCYPTNKTSYYEFTETHYQKLCSGGEPHRWCDVRGLNIAIGNSFNLTNNDTYITFTHIHNYTLGISDDDNPDEYQTFVDSITYYSKWLLCSELFQQSFDNIQQELNNNTHDYGNESLSVLRYNDVYEHHLTAPSTHAVYPEDVIMANNDYKYQIQLGYIILVYIGVILICCPLYVLLVHLVTTNYSAHIAENEKNKTKATHREVNFQMREIVRDETLTCV
jgi:hypothetical protein